MKKLIFLLLFLSSSCATNQFAERYELNQSKAGERFEYSDNPNVDIIEYPDLTLIAPMLIRMAENKKFISGFSYNNTYEFWQSVPSKKDMRDFAKKVGADTAIFYIFKDTLFMKIDMPAPMTLEFTPIYHKKDTHIMAIFFSKIKK